MGTLLQEHNKRLQEVEGNIQAFQDTSRSPNEQVLQSFVDAVSTIATKQDQNHQVQTEMLETLRSSLEELKTLIKK
jgi:hypothetical protein